VTTERHEIPTHLGVEDRAFYGLSVRQVMYLTGGFSLGYSLWTQWGDALPELRIAMAVTCALVAIILALVRPAGRGFEEWAFVVLRYLVIPHRARWSPAELDARFERLLERVARMPINQLVMMKLLVNQTVQAQGLTQAQVLGTFFDGIARHTEEGHAFVRRATESGFREAVRERDQPFGDHGLEGFGLDPDR